MNLQFFKKLHFYILTIATVSYAQIKGEEDQSKY
jgi:hypothetical protein